MLSFGLSKIYLSDYADQTPRHVNIGQHIAANVPSLKEMCETSNNWNHGISTLKALSNAMILLQR